jgi:hypothetical protein
MNEIVGEMFTLLQCTIVIAFVLHLWRHGRPRRENSTISLMTACFGLLLCSHVAANGELVIACATGAVMTLSAYSSYREMRREVASATS